MPGSRVPWPRVTEPDDDLHGLQSSDSASPASSSSSRPITSGSSAPSPSAVTSSSATLGGTTATSARSRRADVPALRRTLSKALASTLSDSLISLLYTTPGRRPWRRSSLDLPLSRFSACSFIVPPWRGAQWATLDQVMSILARRLACKGAPGPRGRAGPRRARAHRGYLGRRGLQVVNSCLLYTSDAADDLLCV